MPQTPRILVIRRRYLGDVVLLGSLFRNLRIHWPEARVAALVEASYATILSLNPDVDSVMALPAGALEWPRFVRRLRAAAFTHVLDIDNTEKTALISRLSGAPLRVGLYSPVTRSRVTGSPSPEAGSWPVGDDPSRNQMRKQE